MSLAALVATAGSVGQAAGPSGSLHASPTSESSPRPISPIDRGSIGWFEDVQHEDGDFLLCVGRLDGRVFEAARSSGRFRGAGPKDGQVLAAWRDDEANRSVIALIDTADGSVRELLRTRLAVTGVAFGPSDDFYYNTVGTTDGRPRGVYRRPIAGDGATRIADGSSKPSFVLRSAVDESAIVVTDERSGDGLESYRVIDARDQTVRDVQGRGAELVGILGDEVVVWDHTKADALVLPLRAIAPDGTERVIADQEGWLAAVFPDLDGAPVLVHDGRDDGDRSVLSAIRVGETEGTPIFTNPYPPYLDPPIQMIWRDVGHGVEAPGFVPVFPGARAYVTSWDGGAYVGLPRLLVPLDGGPPIDLGMQPVGPPGSGCWADSAAGSTRSRRAH